MFGDEPGDQFRLPGYRREATMRALILAVAVAVMFGPLQPAYAQGDRGCPSSAETWMGLKVCEETGDRTGYNRGDFGRRYSSKEAEIIAGLPQLDGQVYTPYTCTLYDIKPNGTADTDIEHIVAMSEAFDSGLPEDDYRAFAADMDNLTIAVPSVNRNQKGVS